MKKIFLLISFCCCAFWSEAQYNSYNNCSVLTSPNISPLLATPGPTPGTTVLSMPNMVPVANSSFIWLKSIDNGLTFLEMTGRTSDTLIVSTNIYALYYCRRSVVVTNYSASSSPSLNLNIPDNSITGVSNSLVINGQESINANTPINVTLNITHTYNGDLYAYLVGPDNCGALELSTNNGSGSDGMNLTLHTTGSFPNITTTYGLTSGLITGDYLTELGVTTAPVSSLVPTTVVPLVSLTGGACPINGSWKLFIADRANQYNGKLNSWALNITNILSDSSGIIQIEPSNNTPSFNIRPFVRGAAPIGNSLISFKAVGAEDSLFYNSTDLIIPTDIPTGYQDSYANNSENQDIINVTFASLNNNSLCGDAAGGGYQSSYSNYTDNLIGAPNVNPGQNVSYAVSTNTCDVVTTNPYAIGIYIDYNRDGDFYDVNEHIVETSINGPEIISGTTTIPSDASFGYTRMRVVLNGAAPGNFPQPSPEGLYFQGETEDYLIYISSPYSPNPYYGYSNLTSFDTCSTNASDSVALNISPYIEYSETYPINLAITNVLIDWNKDGFFDNGTEKILDTTTINFGFNSGSMINYTFKIPNGTPKGNYKMRVATSNIIDYCNSQPDDINLHKLFTPYSFITNTANNNNRYAEFQDFTLNINASAKITGYRNIRCNGDNSTDTIFFHYEGPAITTDSISLYNVDAISGLITPPTSYVSNTGDGYFSNFPPGTYYISINLPSGTNFINTDNVTITQPTAITGVTVASFSNVSCNGGNNGSISLSAVSGGTPFLTQTPVSSISGSWNAATDAVAKRPSSSIINTTTCSFDASVTRNYTITNFQVSVSGSYTFEMQANSAYDGMGYITTGSFVPGNCSGGGTWIVGDDDRGVFNNEPLMTANLTAGVTYTLYATTFANTSGTISAPYTWNISTTSGGQVYLITSYNYSWASVPAGFTAITPDITGLSARDYICTITDANGCNKTVSQTITQPAALVAIVTHTNVLCNGGNTGSVTLTFSGGTSPYAVSFNGGAFGAATSPNVHNNLIIGTYTWTVKDAKGCTVSGSEVVQEPTALVATDAHTNLLCFGDSSGTVTTTFSGGTSPYQISFNGRPFGAATSPNVQNSLSASTHTWIVKDANGCTVSGSEVVEQPTALLLSTNITPVTCFGGSNGSITGTASNGTAPYEFQWNTSSTITTGVTSTINNLTAGLYFVSLKDNRGCRQQFQVIVGTPPQMLINGTVVYPTCSFNCDGSITLNNTITNAVGPVTYLWNNGSTSQNISSLCVGKDTVTITDSRGCTEKKGFELLASAAERVNLGPDKILCANQSYYGNVTINNPANNSPYVWTGPNGYTSNAPLVYINQTGEYIVQVKDINGCVGKDTINVTATNGIIAAEFIATTQAYKGRKVTLLNVSSPAPNSIEWQIPTTNLITTLSQTPLQCELVFNDIGTYTIKMKATTTGGCDSTFAKTINVIDSTEFGTPSDYILDPLVKLFSVAPNPNNGNFSVKLNLLSNSKIKLRLINILTNQTVNTREEAVQKNQDYSFDYNVSVPAGVYILVLETPVTSRIIKVVIN